MYLNVPKNAAVYILLTVEGGVMSNEFYSVIDLPPAQFHQAYPLLQVSGADFTLDQWLEYAKGLHERRDEGAGILSAVSRVLLLFGPSEPICWSIIDSGARRTRSHARLLGGTCENIADLRYIGPSE
jgi:hypothetical protein